MDAPFNQVPPLTSWEGLFNFWNSNPDAVPFAGGIQFLHFQGKRAPALPRKLIALEDIEELHLVTRTEQYLELGAMVRLSEIIHLGTIVPEILRKCLEGIAGPQLRNSATIGGNICTTLRYMDSCAALIALDAHYELRSMPSVPPASFTLSSLFSTQSSTRWIAASRFTPASLAPRELLTRIRIPLESWNYSLYRKFRCSDLDRPNLDDGVIVLLLRNQKDILTDIRIVFAGRTVLKDKRTESLLSGKHLPLNCKDARAAIAQWETCLATLPPEQSFIRTELSNFVTSSLLGLVD
ncbi:MAG: FAD binding domain-containing protein [Treponema sp.]|jgi:CO/xanthine dehydrogenase FAD-binding subunit|nr:FAD binding domain-containing protein [Treponema sp.]